MTDKNQDSILVTAPSFVSAGSVSPQENAMTGTQPDVSKPSKGGWSFRTIEPVMVVTFYIVGVSASPLTDLVMRQSCRQLHLDPANCSSDESTEEEIHRMSSSFSMWHMIIDTLPGCIISLFSSPWSDTNGRKPVIIIALIGTALSQASLSYMSTIPDLHPYVLLFSGVPMVFTGGPILLILNCTCYIIDVTNMENRVIRIAVLMNASAMGVVIAQFTAPPLERMGYDWVFASNTVLVLACTLYVIILLPESVNVVEDKRKKFFTIDHLVDSCQTFFKKRPSHARGILFCLLMASLTILIIGTGEPDVKYLSTIKKFNWTLKDYSTYNAVSTVLIVLGTVSGVYIGLKVLKLSEQMFCVIVMVTLIISTIWTARSTSTVEFYVASQMRVFSTCLGPVVKSSISKVVPLEEVAKVIAFQSSAEAFMPQIAAIIYAKFYNLVVGVDPFAVYYLSTFLCVIASICFVINMVLYRKGNWDRNETSQETEKKMNEKPASNTTPEKDLEAYSSL